MKLDAAVKPQHVGGGGKCQQALISWRFNLWVGLVFSGLLSALWGILDLISGHVYSQYYMAAWNICIRFLTFSMVSFLVFALKEKLSNTEKEANTDFLTGVMNLRYIMSIIKLELERTKRGGPAFSIIYLDVDGFKSINDIYGHRQGDKLLQQIATTFK